MLSAFAHGAQMLLLSLGADIQSKSFANYTPLHFAAQVEACSRLVCLLILSMKGGFVDAVRCLLKAGADALAVLDNGYEASTAS
jgi:ankyrin repeat protein